MRAGTRPAPTEGDIILKKRQLARRYFPYARDKTAVRNLMRWIDNCPPLRSALSETGYRRTAKDLTILQVSLIEKYLGESGR